MRIAISGSHGVGKTTLATAIANGFKIPRIEEVARSVAKEFGFETNEQILTADKDTIRLFQRRIFYRQLMAEYEHKEFISDRSIFDVIAYMQLYGLYDMAAEYIPLASKCSAAYHIIIFCPIPTAIIDQGVIENDGFRLTDCQSQAAISYLISKLIKDRAKCEVLYLPDNRGIWQRTVELQLMGTVRPL